MKLANGLKSDPESERTAMLCNPAGYVNAVLIYYVTWGGVTAHKDKC